MAASNLHENHRARMQARVERDGVESLAEHEALEYLLYLSIPRMDTNELAHRLIEHFGDFCKVMEAEQEELAQVDGIGPKSARRIWRARKQAALGLDELKRMGVVLKRAQYFITCRGFAGAHPGRGSAGRERITRALIDPNVFSAGAEQLSMFAPPAVDRLVEQGVPPRTAQRMVREEAVQCLARAL